MRGGLTRLGSYLLRLMARSLWVVFLLIGPLSINIKSSLNVAGDSGVLGVINVGSDTTSGKGTVKIGVGTGFGVLQFGVSSNFGTVSAGGGEFILANSGNSFLTAFGNGLELDVYQNWGWATDLQFGVTTVRFGYNHSGNPGRPYEAALGSLAIAHPNNGGTLLVRGKADIASYSSGNGGNPTTTVNASTTLVLNPNGEFVQDIAVGDRVAVSSAPSTYASVTSITNSNTLVLSTALGNGTSQTLSVKHSILRVEDSSGNLLMFMDDLGNYSLNTNLGIGLSGPQDASTVVQIDSTTQGFLPPRMTTTQKNAISTPATGLIVFDTTLAKLAVWTGAAWETVTSV